MKESRTVFTDASVLINFLHLGRLDLFGKIDDVKSMDLATKRMILKGNQLRWPIG